MSAVAVSELDPVDFKTLIQPCPVCGNKGCSVDHGGDADADAGEDIDELDLAALDARVRQAYPLYRRLGEQHLDAGKRLGRLLNAAKRQVRAAGIRWYDWLAERQIAPRTASRVMAITRESAKLADLGPDATQDQAEKLLAERRRTERRKPAAVVERPPQAHVTLLVGDAREVLRELGHGRAHVVMTSPPYWGLRDYGLPPLVWGGDPEHAHAFALLPMRFNPGGNDPSTSSLSGGGRAHQVKVGHTAPMGELCTCGAWRGSLGLEPVPDCLGWARGEPPCAVCYVCHLRTVFAAVWPVLRDDGTLWLNLGDSYAGSGKGPSGWNGAVDDQERRQGFTGEGRKRATGRANGTIVEGGNRRRGLGEGLDRRLGVKPPFGFKAKDLLGIPWRVAFALQADGWYLRMDNVWAKPNPMPESVTDRPTRAHEYVFLFSKRKRYFYDALAVAEPTTGNAQPRGTTLGPKAVAVGYAPGRETPNETRLHRVNKVPSGWASGEGRRKSTELVGRYRPEQHVSFSAAVAGLVNERNKRSVWTVQTQPFRGAHFATFPEALAEVAIQAGSSERGCCPACGAPWRRVVRVDGRASVARATTPKGETRDAQKLRTPERLGHGPGWRQEPVAVATTLGWEPSCACPPADPAPCVVLDPFAGALTTNLVAARLGRDSIAIELKPEYAEIGKRRLLEEAPLLVTFDEGGA